MTPLPFHLDRQLNFIELPAFLRAVQPKEHDWWRPPLTGALVVGGGWLFALFGYGLAGVVNRRLIANLMPGDAAQAMLADPKLITVDCQTCLMGGLTKTVVLGGVCLGFLIATLLFATLINRRPALTWITTAPTFRWRLFLAGLLLFSLVLGVISAIPEALHGWPDRPVVLKSGETDSVRLTYALAMLIILPVAAAAEEVFCRGWLMQTTSAFTPNLFAILVFNSVLFSLMHVDGDVGRNIVRVVMGMIFSYGALRLGGLEFGIGLHTANNLVILLLADTQPQPEHIAPSTTGGVLANLGVGAAALALIELTARWPALRRLTRLEAYPAATEATS